MTVCVLVHGAWHGGELLEPVVGELELLGLQAFAPTLVGNREEEPPSVGLKEAIQSLVDYLETQDMRDVILCGHSYGGMLITGAADVCPERIKRLVYWNAFVPNDGESLYNMLPQEYVDLFEDLAKRDGRIMLPFNIWREAFMNDAGLEQARRAYSRLRSHPRNTFAEPIVLEKNPREFAISKSFINCTEDIALPQSSGWHPRLSEKLGLFRLVQTPGGHELCFTNPVRLAQKIVEAGRE
tara:strand:+ start:405 stop:1124 length:720 start_codon:yes stop_codon:yes gene_type:complete